jgi:hypothetical protein
MQARLSVTSNSPAPELGLAARTLDYVRLLRAILRLWVHARPAP